MLTRLSTCKGFGSNPYLVLQSWTTHSAVINVTLNESFGRREYDICGSYWTTHSAVIKIDSKPFSCVERLLGRMRSTRLRAFQMFVLRMFAGKWCLPPMYTSNQICMHVSKHIASESKAFYALVWAVETIRGSYNRSNGIAGGEAESVKLEESRREDRKDLSRGSPNYEQSKIVFAGILEGEAVQGEPAILDCHISVSRVPDHSHLSNACSISFKGEGNYTMII